MTSEQIAELRKWCNSDSYELPDADAILKALDEREALLEVLRKVTTADASMGDIRDAIAKAEAP